jgi:hypothetical protein
MCGTSVETDIAEIRVIHDDPEHDRVAAGVFQCRCNGAGVASGGRKVVYIGRGLHAAEHTTFMDPSRHSQWRLS